MTRLPEGATSTPSEMARSRSWVVEEASRARKTSWPLLKKLRMVDDLTPGPSPLVVVVVFRRVSEQNRDWVEE